MEPFFKICRNLSLDYRRVRYLVQSNKDGMPFTQGYLRTCSRRKTIVLRGHCHAWSSNVQYVNGDSLQNTLHSRHSIAPAMLVHSISQYSLPRGDSSHILYFWNFYLALHCVQPPSPAHLTNAETDKVSYTLLWLPKI